MTTTYTITGNITTGVSLTSPTYGSPVTIAPGVTVSGSTYAIYAGTDWAIQNYGTLSGADSNGDGVELKTGGSVTNESDATITGHFGIYSHASGASATVDNSGGIYGERDGVFLGNGGSVTNETTGSIGGADNGIYLGQSGTVINMGSISGAGGAGVYAYAAGHITNQNSGTISGATGVDVGNGTIDNLGSIAGTSANAIYFYTNGWVTNAASATITGDENGVYLKSNGSVTNLSGGTIGGVTGDGIFAKGTAATVENAGTISGGNDSVYLDATGSNRLIVDAGAVFTGDVVAKAGATNNTIELKAGASASTLSGFGTQYQGFQTIAIDGNAAWTVGGTTAALEGVTIDGFNSHDQLDLTDLTYNGADTATVYGSDQLVIDDPNGNITIQMDGNVSGHLFTVAQDSNGDTFVEESDYTPPCYCRGTRIRTPKGEVAVEALRIGDRVTIADGTVLPIKWIGRRSYRDWLAVGNPEVQPILFKAGSIADHVPMRDLYVSPEHAMFLDGVLVPALHLVNGISILKVEGMEEIEYFHFEFDRHVVIYAEGAAAESFVDDDSRMLFHNADEYRRLYPDEPRGLYAEFCAPRVEAGYELDIIRRRLTARAGGSPAAVQQGYLDRATRTVIEGWAYAGAGEAPVKLAILVNGAVVGQTVADRYRADLGIGDGHCSFRFDLPRGLSPDVSHRIEVRRESDWSPLTGGCVTLKPEAESRRHINDVTRWGYGLRTD